MYIFISKRFLFFIFIYFKEPDPKVNLLANKKRLRRVTGYKLTIVANRERLTTYIYIYIYIHKEKHNNSYMISTNPSHAHCILKSFFLEKLDNSSKTKRNVEIISFQKFLCNFSWGNLYILQQSFDLSIELVVNFDIKKIRSQQLEPIHGAIRHEHVHIHAAWAQQSWIKLLLMIGREHNNSLISTA